MKKIYSFIFIAALLMTGCVEPSFGPIDAGDMIPLNIDGSIQQVQTKATAAGFVNGDAVGLFAVNYTNDNATAGTLAASGNQADNVKYVFDEPNQKWVPVRPVYYKDVNTNVDLFLYYPFQSGISDVNAANFEVKKDQSTAATSTELSGYEASDWMWGKGTNIAPSESKVRVALYHRLSAVQVTLVEGTGFESGEFASLSKNVIAMGTTRKATLDYATGAATPLGSAQLDGIVMCPQNDGGFRAVVIPQTVAGGTQLFAITLGGTSYSWKQDGAMNYQAGKQVNVSLTINKKSPSGSYEIAMGSTTITDWTEDRNSHGGEARQYFVVNVATPGTLQATIEAQGKNPAKIKNLKVIGQVNNDDFYYMRDQMTILEAVNMKECRVVQYYPAGWRQKNGEWREWPEETIYDVIPDSAFKGKQSLVYFVFPQQLTEIGGSAFTESNLSGPLVIPDGVKVIGGYAFESTKITSIQFPASLTKIEAYAFASCSSVTGSLILPDNLLYIGNSAFRDCRHFSGSLFLPDNLEYIGYASFEAAGSFTSDLVIPEKITSIPGYCFNSTAFSGHLDLRNVTEVDEYAFCQCWFSGELVIPEGFSVLPSNSFRNNCFSSVLFPSSLVTIEGCVFAGCEWIVEPIIIPEGVVYIGNEAFSYVRLCPSIELPSTLITIQDRAFNSCYTLSSIVCNAIEPPTIMSDTFNGVAKDNFTVEVPVQSVSRYQTEMGWSDFKRFGAHYDFSISRRTMQALNASYSRKLTLRAPSGFDWSIQSKPDWVTVSPSSGTGKTDVTITISEMARTNDTFEVNEGSFNQPDYKYYKGRSGEVVFLLDGKNYTSTLTVEQYDSDFADGSVETLYTHSQGNGIDLVFTGEGYSARDIANGKLRSNAIEGYGHFFDVEPYKTYKDYFNVYVVTAMSPESGIGTENTVIDTKFNSVVAGSTFICGNVNEAFKYAKKARSGMVLSKSLTIMLANYSLSDGTTYWYDDGSALSCCPVSTHGYPYDFRGVIQHEAGGHGFGKLGDEWIIHNTFIQYCMCECCDHPGQGDLYDFCKARGWFRNLSTEADSRRVPWAHMIYHPQYSDYVDMYEGAYHHSRGIYRSEVTSCMNSNVPYFNAISRQAIVERIKLCAGQQFKLDDFYARDSRAVGPTTKAGAFDPTFGVDPNLNLATGYGPILMGEHPNVQ